MKPGTSNVLNVILQNWYIEYYLYEAWYDKCSQSDTSELVH